MKNQKKQPKQTPFNQYWIFGSIVFVFLLLNIFSGTSANDVFGFNIFQNNAKLFVLGIKIKYTT